MSEKYHPNAAAATITVAMSSQKQVRSRTERMRNGYVRITATTQNVPSPTSPAVTGPVTTSATSRRGEAWIA